MLLNNIHKEEDLRSYRFERKFLITQHSYPEVEAAVKCHPALFSEIYNRRCVNNIYFDSSDMTHYFEHVEGAAEKIKIRIRWYGELFGLIKKPVLEIKMRNNSLGRKLIYQLSSFAFTEDFQHQIIIDALDRSDIPDLLKIQMASLMPVLCNRYRRKYFQSESKDFRLTLDNDLCFYKVCSNYNSFVNKAQDNSSTILELKYDFAMQERAEEITSHFPFRLTKISKAISGIGQLHY